MKPYKTVGAAAQDEIVINKSRFIGHAARCETEQEALDFLRSVREKYRDASHNCYAYIIGQNMGVMRYSDDGEPGGTAGLPIIETMKAMEVTDCCVVVTRYFGGILLGAGGLTRAYRKGCEIALHAAQVVLMTPSIRFLMEVDYSLWDRTRYALKSLPAQLEETKFGAAVEAALLARTEDAESVQQALISVTDGKIEFLTLDEGFHAWPESVPEQK